MSAGITAIEEKAAETYTLTADGVGRVRVPERGLASDKEGCAPTGFDTDAKTGAGAEAFVETLAGSTGKICGGD